MVRSVKDAPIKRKAASDILLPAVAGPGIGINTTVDDWPVAGFVTRPCISVCTNGVLIHSPGSVALPNDTTVLPSTRAPCAAGAVAAARCAAVVVSSASAVRAAGGGGGADVTGSSTVCSTLTASGMPTAPPIAASAARGLPRPNLSDTAPQADKPKPKLKRIKKCFMSYD